MFNSIFKKALLVAIITVLIDFVFHYFLTNPMETLTYFVIKFLLAFTVATALFSYKPLAKSKHPYLIIFITGLIFSALMSTYYRAWELGEAYAPFGSRAPDIFGITRDNLLLFSGTWWLGHGLFFTIGGILAKKLWKK
ncbi:MAG: hypothetical protein WC873_03065 [Candidatus Gracilibacteria bacterium]